MANLILSASMTAHNHQKLQFPGIPTPSSHLFRYQAHTWCTYIRANTRGHKIYLENKILRIMKVSEGVACMSSLGSQKSPDVYLVSSNT